MEEEITKELDDLVSKHIVQRQKAINKGQTKRDNVRYVRQVRPLVHPRSAEDEDNIIVHWPESQKWMEHPEANLIDSDDEPSMYSVPKRVIEEYPDGYYDAESFFAEGGVKMANGKTDYNICTDKNLHHLKKDPSFWKGLKRGDVVCGREVNTPAKDMTCCGWPMLNDLMDDEGTNWMVCRCGECGMCSKIIGADEPIFYDDEANMDFCSKKCKDKSWEEDEYNFEAPRVYRGARPSPSTSATSVNVGTKMRGGNGKFWVCKTYPRGNKRIKRWVLAAEDDDWEIDDRDLWNPEREAIDQIRGNRALREQMEEQGIHIGRHPGYYDDSGRWVEIEGYHDYGGVKQVPFWVQMSIVLGAITGVSVAAKKGWLNFGYDEPLPDQNETEDNGEA